MPPKKKKEEDDKPKKSDKKVKEEDDETKKDEEEKKTKKLTQKEKEKLTKLIKEKYKKEKFYCVGKRKKDVSVKEIVSVELDKNPYRIIAICSCCGNKLSKFISQSSVCL